IPTKKKLDQSRHAVISQKGLESRFEILVVERIFETCGFDDRCLKGVPEHLAIHAVGVLAELLRHPRYDFHCRFPDQLAEVEAAERRFQALGLYETRESTEASHGASGPSHAASRP